MDQKKIFKQNLLDQLYNPYRHCNKCPLATLGRQHVVFGAGNPDARLMFIGEAPGADEDTQGKPFIGRAGQLLNKSFEAIGIRRENVFITNIVKCRPPKNRTPTLLEMETCKDLLLIKQIKIIRPHVICTLGAAAIQGLLNQPTIKISHARGKKIIWQDIIIIPTYHPAYILRNPKELKTLISDLEIAYNTSQQSSLGGG